MRSYYMYACTMFAASAEWSVSVRKKTYTRWINAYCRHSQVSAYIICSNRTKAHNYIIVEFPKVVLLGGPVVHRKVMRFIPLRTMIYLKHAS